VNRRVTLSAPITPKKSVANWSRTLQSELHHSQFRVFSFAVVLFGNTGRLLRWDRSGVIYTEPFNWANEPDTLFEFVWRLNFLSDVERGYDTTVTSVNNEQEAEAALSKLRRTRARTKGRSSQFFCP